MHNGVQIISDNDERLNIYNFLTTFKPLKLAIIVKGLQALMNKLHKENDKISLGNMNFIQSWVKLKTKVFSPWQVYSDIYM